MGIVQTFLWDVFERIKLIFFFLGAMSVGKKKTEYKMHWVCVCGCLVAAAHSCEFCFLDEGTAG